MKTNTKKNPIFIAISKGASSFLQEISNFIESGQLTVPIYSNKSDSLFVTDYQAPGLGVDGKLSVITSVDNGVKRVRFALWFNESADSKRPISKLTGATILI